MIRHYTYLQSIGLNHIHTLNSGWLNTIGPKSFIWSDVIDAFLAYILGALSCGVTVSMIKVLAGRPRPDFFNRCFPDVNIYDSAAVQSKIDQVTKNFGNLICDNPDTHFVNEARKSFPSGHSSTAFSFFWFMSLYLG